MAILELISSSVQYLITTISSMGYLGIFLLMAIESTIFPLPSELVLIPAGVLVQRGEMNVLFVIIFSALGSLLGSLLIYFLSRYLGRKVVDSLVKKYGKFVFLDEYSIIKSEFFFKKHGEITIFISRLLPVVRHLISIPAGFSKMPIWKFSVYTLFGSAFWSLVLIYFGYFFGIAIANKNMSLITILFVIFCLLIIGLYMIVNRNRNKVMK
ncbi:MAG: DedA family protein [Nanoarchaeota archaeon]